ncbi:hypothetical protein QFZ20_005131 [Flavobacterium sp. W4I14]|nr:hypothetical protein [Flavobacterium sp. W4I14]
MKNNLLLFIFLAFALIGMIYLGGYFIGKVAYYATHL